MGYNLCNFQKRFFINKYRWFDVLKDWYQFLGEIKVTKLYLVKFEEDNFIKLKVYLNTYIVKDINYDFIIFIIYNENTFNINNSYQQIWQKKTILYFDQKIELKILWFLILYYFGLDWIYYFYFTKIKMILVVQRYH